MTKPTKPTRSPSKFVGLHSHSTLSIGDAIGLPQDHIDFAIENGSDALALTDHGNMNGYSHQYLHAMKLKEKGVNFKAIPGCLLKGQPIITKCGVKTVEDIQVGDEVLTHKGRFRKVLSLMRRPYSGKLFSVFLAQTNVSLKLTEEHPILIRTKDNVLSWKKPGEISTGRPNKCVGVNSWKSWVSFPKLEQSNFVIDCSKHIGSEFIWRSNDKCVRVLKPNKYYEASLSWKIPRQIELTQDVSRLLGFYLAEGWANEDGSFGFTFNLKEVEYQNFVIEQLSKLNIKATLRPRVGRGSADIEACNKPFANLLIKLFGKGAKNKFIPEEFMLCSNVMKKAFISGLIDGDGKAKTEKNSQRNLKVASPHLAWGFKALLASQGFWSKVTTGNDGPHHFWAVSFSPERKWTKTISDDKGIYKPVKEITFEKVENIEVFNFEVEEDNSYCSDFILHNCEAYFIPSLEDWKKLYDTRQVEKAQQKTEKEALKKSKARPKTVEELANQYADVEEEISGAKEVDDEDEGGTVVENEEETKRNKPRDPLMRRSHLVLLAKNSEGLKSLFQLVSDSYIDGFYRYPRMDFDNLKKYAKGNIVATSACMGGEPAKVIFDNQSEPDWNKWVPNDENFEKIQKELTELGQRFQRALGEENFYWELQFNKINAQHLLNYHLIENNKRTGIPLVVTADAHYSSPNHWRERLIYKAMAQQQIWKQQFDSASLPKTLDELECELYPKNADQIWASYLDTGKSKFDFYDDDIVCDAVERTWTIAHEQIEDPEPDRKVKLPVLTKLVSTDELDKLKSELSAKNDGIGGTEEELSFAALVDQAKKGITFRRLNEKDNFSEYMDRLKHELSVIKKLEFSKYFLTYAKVMDVVGQHQLIGAARGSAGGSLLSYVLGITQVDPIRFGLLFERFLTSKKKGFPDIDSDFSDRDSAVKLLIDYFGDENVVPVSNFAQLQVASLCKDLARLYDVPFDLVNKYTAQMRAEALSEAKKQPGFDAQVWDFTFDVANADSPSFRKFVEEMSKTHPQFKDALDTLFKQMRTISRHAGGVIITKDTRENMPIIKAKGGLQTPWSEGLNFRHLENFGFLKFDILGLGTLRMFEDCIRRILKNKGRKYVQFKDIQKFFYENLHPDNNAMDDKHVYKTVYWDGKYAGIFQFIKENTQAFMKEMKPRSIQDIAIATSLHRPGPLSLGVDKLYLSYRKNPQEIVYKHPLLKDVFAETSGLLVFQEQLQMIYHKLAGVDLEDTDGVRKAFTKKDMSNKAGAEAHRQKLREDFALGCKATNDIPERVSFSIFDEMEKLVAYSFNKSHAVAYAINSYQCVHGQTKIFDWDRKRYTTVAKAFREGNVENIACFNEVTKETVSGKIKKIVRTTGAKNRNLKMAYVLKTKGGSKLVCSKDHPILTENGEYVNLENLSIGDKIAVERRVLSRVGKIHSDDTKQKISSGVQNSWSKLTEFEKTKRMINLQVAANNCRKSTALIAKQWWKDLDPQEKKERVLKMQHAAIGTNGWNNRFVGTADCGHKVFSKNELALCNWLHANGLEHDTQVSMKTFGFCDVVCKGVYIEFDGIGRPDEYFEKKFGDEPFVKLTNVNQIDEELNFLLQDTNILAGNEIVYDSIVSIEPWKPTVMYDISMENEPHNFLANNIVVHNCAWFMTYYPDEWTSAYIDYCSTSKGKVSGQEDPKVVAQNEAKALGYEIGKPDINLSEHETIIKDGTVLPSFNTLKHIGTSVQREIHRFRPYKKVEELLWDSGGNWRHSKFNKRALATLIRLEGLDSMKIVGEGKPFPNYAAAHYVLVDKADELKRACSRKKNRNHQELLNGLLEEAQKIEPWTTAERIVNQKELVGSVDIDLIVNKELKKKLRELAIRPINKREGKEDIVWGIVSSKEVKKTKTGKWFMKLRIYGEDAVQHLVFVWGYDPTRNKQDIQTYDIVIGQYSDSNFGLSAFYNKVKKLKT